ncbi:MAG: septal ring lytic transglycosylase RlpA family protein [Gammaproteobacteria bacterium]
MMRLALPALAILLAACSAAPKKPTPPPATSNAAPAAQPAGPRKRSPYPPAQEDLSKRGDYVAGGLYAPHIRDSAPAELPRVDLIPEPDVVDEPRSRYGNRSPYTVLGRSYAVLDSTEGFVEQGLASFYGNKFHGRRTSNLEVYDMYAFTAAHKTLPLPSFARVTNLENGRSVIVRVNDRGPFHEGRVIDLSWAAAVKLDLHRAGTARVEVRALPARPGSYAALQAELAREARGPAAAPSALDALVAGLPAQPAAAAAPVQSAVAAPEAAGAGVVAAAVVPAPAAGGEYRFDMQRDGRVMTADQFDAWMRERGVRVATGVAGRPAPREAVAASTAAAPVEAPDRLPPVAAPPAAGVVLQVASFAARDNAERALALLQGAGIAGAGLHDGVADGRPVWRLRIGPVDGAAVAELSTLVAGLGFGPPQVVRGR